MLQLFRLKRYNMGRVKPLVLREGCVMKFACVTAVLATIGVTAALAQQPAPPPAPPYGMPVTLDQAIKAATAAMAKAQGIAVPNAVAVVEPSGDLVYFAKMSGAPYSAVQLAQQKAVASARYRRPTKAFYDGIEGGHPFFLTFPMSLERPAALRSLSMARSSVRLASAAAMAIRTCWCRAPVSMR